VQPSPSVHLPDFLKVLAHELRWKILTSLAHSDQTVTEIVHFLQEPQNVVSYHLRKLRELHVVCERRSSADSRDVYYSLDFDTFRTLYEATGEAIHPMLKTTATTNTTVLPSLPSSPIRVLFACTHNSVRSQIAEGLLRHLSHGQIEVYSAGYDPSMVHPLTKRVMLALEIDISQQQAKSFDAFREQSFDYIVTVCDRTRESIPTFPGQPDTIHWSIPDPLDLPASDDEQYQVFEQLALQLVTRTRYFLTWIEHAYHQRKGTIS